MILDMDDMNVSYTTAQNIGDMGVPRITIDDIDELVRLHEEYLNYGEGIRPHFIRVLHDPDTVALKYAVDGKMAGILIYTKGIALSGSHDDIAARLEEMCRDKVVYTGDAVLVRKEYRGMGIADILCHAMIGELRRRGAKLVVHEFWVYPDGKVPAYRMCRIYTNSVFLGRFENFYRDFHHYGYYCPICKKECICSADIYLAEVPEGCHPQYGLG